MIVGSNLCAIEGKISKAVALKIHYYLEYRYASARYSETHDQSRLSLFSRPTLLDLPLPKFTSADLHF